MKKLTPFILLLVVTWTGCGPQVETLMRNRHYNEAICAGAEANRGTRRRVVQTLARESGVHLHVEEVSQAEIRPVLGKKTDSFVQRVHLLRVRAQTNVLPVDNLALDASVYDAGGQGGAAPVSWRTLAWATGERLPGPRRYQTYWHGGNVLRALVAMGTAGLSLIVTSITKKELLPFTKRTFLKTAPHSAYVRLAPNAAALQRLMRRRGCHALKLPAAHRSSPRSGVKCVWYFLATRSNVAHWHLKLHYRFTAKRIGRSLARKQRRCVLKHVHLVTLGRGSQLSRHLSKRFGKRYRQGKHRLKSLSK